MLRLSSVCALLLSSACLWLLMGCDITVDVSTSGCENGDSRPGECGNTCICDTGTWNCTERPCERDCEPGDSRAAPDGCNTCTCEEDGQWACTEIACNSDCQPGSSRPAPDGCNTCTCEADGQWACTDIACPAEMCLDASDCEPVFIQCNCDWSCIIDGTEAAPDDCDVSCPEARPSPPVCECVEGQCSAAEPPGECEPGDTLDADNGQSCLCDENRAWVCLCPQEPPQPHCVCGAEGDWVCEPTPNMCMENDCQAHFDRCECQWNCQPADLEPELCGRACPEPPGPEPECACEDGQCEPVPCTPGDLQDIDDGCTRCACLDAQTWSCEPINCQPPECEPGATSEADNGQSCECGPDGFWICACAEDPPQAGCLCQEQVWMCPPPPEDVLNCVEQNDCVVSGCNQELCGPIEMGSVCAASPEFACYRNPEVTTCGCQAGRCGWTESEALTMCLENAGREREMMREDAPSD